MNQFIRTAYKALKDHLEDSDLAERKWLLLLQSLVTIGLSLSAGDSLTKSLFEGQSGQMIVLGVQGALTGLLLIDWAGYRSLPMRWLDQRVSGWLYLGLGACYAAHGFAISATGYTGVLLFLYSAIAVACARLAYKQIEAFGDDT